MLCDFKKEKNRTKRFFTESLLCARHHRVWGFLWHVVPAHNYYEELGRQESLYPCLIHEQPEAEKCEET